jgi:hypothetical protein
VTQLLREFITAKEANDMETEAEAIKAQAQLDIMERALKEFEVAKWLIDTQGVKTVGEALRRIEERDAERIANAVHIPEDSDLNPTLKAAFANTRQAKGREPIKLGVNRTPILNGKSVTKKSSFKNIVSQSDKEFNKLTAEDNITNHRSSNGELEWINPSKDRNTKNKVRVIKGAVRKSVANRAACEAEHFGINETAMNILKRHISLKEAATPAARTLATHKVNEPSVRSQLPKAFYDSGLANIQLQKNVDNATRATTQLPTDDIAIRMPEYDTRSMLPPEFRPKIAGPATDYLKADGRMKNPTAAEATRDRKVFTKTNYENPEETPAGETADRYWPHPEPTTKTNSGPDSYKENAKRQKTRQGYPSASTDLANPRDINSGNMNV